MIDKDGKLFGKINIIDLIIIVAVVAVLLVVGIRAISGDAPGGKNGEQVTVRATFYGSDVYPALVESMHVGDPVSPYDTELDFGKLVSVSSEQSFSYAYDFNTGEIIEVPIFDRVRVTLVCELNAEVGEDGLIVEDSTWAVGQHSYMNVGNTRSYYYLKSYEVVGDGAAA